MDFLAELLPAGYALKPELASKDQKQKPAGGEQKKAETQNENDEPEEVIEVRRAVSSWNDVDRRQGERRKQFVKRGRWLDSRLRNDRRASRPEIFVKI